jgi:gluconolactonase
MRQSLTEIHSGGTNYKEQLLFLGEGQGEAVAPAMYLMNPRPPYNTTGKLVIPYSIIHLRVELLTMLSLMLAVILDNFFGRQFNSLNDVSINPRNGDIYFTDPTYGYVQDFRPPPALPKQVWRFNPATGAVTVAADGFNMPNGKERMIEENMKQTACQSWSKKLTMAFTGLSFSPSGSHLYIADTGMIQVFFGTNFTFPATM